MGKGMICDGDATDRTKSAHILAWQLADYRLTTAQIIYHMPDYPALLQSYIWQELDLAPRFPILRKFLSFWETKLDAKLHAVHITHTKIITPGTFRHVDEEIVLH